MPSAAALVVLAKLGGFVAFAYFLRIGRFPTVRTVAAFFLLVIGYLGLYEGFILAAREDSRARYGSVIPGVVLEKYRTEGRGHSVASNGRRGPTPGVSAFLMTRAFAHRIAYGSFAIRIVDYRFSCDAGYGTCQGRDYVSPELWGRLSVGGMVNVKQAHGEGTTARLDENPQMLMALAQMAISGLFIGGSALLSGRTKLRTQRKYTSAPAVVTSVQAVKYLDDTRWKVHFAYLDKDGVAQESVDEVGQPTWKAGDDCVAIYRAEAPDLATLQPAP